MWAWLCCFLPLLACFPCRLTIFPANYPVVLWAQAMWQPASALAPRNDLGGSEDSGSLFAFQASPEADKKPSAGGTACTPSPCGLLLPGRGLVRTSTKSPQKPPSGIYRQSPAWNFFCAPFFPPGSTAVEP